MLCTHLEHDCVIAGGFDGDTYHIDPRTSMVTSRHRYHEGCVLAVAVDDSYILSVGEDRALVVFDRRGNTAQHIRVGYDTACDK